MRWRRRQRPQGVPRFARERDALAHLIAKTDNTAIAELARLRLRAARFADDRLTSTTPARAAPTQDALDVELRRSLATTTARPRAASLLDLSAKVPAIDRIAEANRATVTPAARPTYVPSVFVGGLILLATIALALHLNRGWLAMRIAAVPDLATVPSGAVVILLLSGAAIVCLRRRFEGRRRSTSGPDSTDRRSS